MKIKDIIKKSKMNWEKVNNSNPAFKSQGQTEFTWENHYKLKNEAEKFDNQEIKLNDVKNVKREKE